MGPQAVGDYSYPSCRAMGNKSSLEWSRELGQLPTKTSSSSFHGKILGLAFSRNSSTALAAEELDVGNEGGGK